MNRCNEISDADEGAAPYPLPGQFSKPALDEIQPTRTGRNEVEHKAWMPLQPFLHLGMFMGTVVIQHHVQFHFGGKFRIQAFQEFKELLMTMSGVTLPYYFSLRQFKCGKERRGAIALVVMGHGAAAALFQRQSRLCAIQCLNLTLLVHAEHQCFLRRVEVKADHVGKFLQELRSHARA